MKIRCAMFVMAALMPALTALAEVFVPVDINHSTVGFAVPILGGLSEVTGKFGEAEVEWNFDGSDIATTTIKAVIQTKSVDTGIDQRDMHLRTRDFFDVRKHPTMTFESDSVEKTDLGYVAHGTFTMLGVSKELALPFRITGLSRDSESGQVSIGLLAELTIDRSEFGMTYQHKSVDGFFGTNIAVRIHLLTKSFAAESGFAESIE